MSTKYPFRGMINVSLFNSITSDAYHSLDVLQVVARNPIILGMSLVEIIQDVVDGSLV